MEPSRIISRYKSIKYTVVQLPFSDIVDLQSCYNCAILLLANLARGKPAFQKDMGWGGLPARGVDGNRNGQWGGASCTHTNIHSQAWWAVDLGKEMSITRVSISNRADCCCKFTFQIRFVFCMCMPLCV